MIVVLLVADSVRSDAPGFGGGPALTPHLDRLATEGTRFDSCYSSAAWTVPSLVSLATGTFAHRVGVARWRHPFPRRRPTLMSAFDAAGFDVRCVVHNPRFCLANTGFRGTVADSEDPKQVIEALTAPAGADRLVFIHHWWTHLPYVCEQLGRKDWRRSCDLDIAALGEDPDDAVPRLRDRYHDALAWFDAELLGRYLDAARSNGNDVLFAFTADHGENWGGSVPDDSAVEHMYDLHGRWITDETTHVPFVLWGNGVGGAVPVQSLEGLSRGVDVAPTLAALAGVPWPGPLPEVDGPTLHSRGIDDDGSGLELDGVSLVESVTTGAPSPIVEALTVTSHNAIVPARYPRSGRRMWSRFGLRTPDRRFVWDGLFGLRQVADLTTGTERVPPTRVARLADRLVVTPRVWSRLAEERRGALGPAEKLPKELYPKFGAKGEDGDADGPLEEQMRLLGYTDD